MVVLADTAAPHEEVEAPRETLTEVLDTTVVVTTAMVAVGSAIKRGI